MKKISITLALFMCALLGLNASVITFKVKNQQKESTLYFYFTDKTEKVAINEAGNGTLTATNETPKYAQLQYGRATRTVYIDGKQDLTISFDANSFKDQITFAGKNAAINNYLNSGKLKTFTYKDATVKEDLFIKKLDSLFAVNKAILNKAKLPKDFASLENIRLKYYTYSSLPSYASSYKYLTKDNSYIPSANFYTKIELLQTIDANLLSLYEYQSFLKSSISTLALKDNQTGNAILTCANYIDQTIKNQKVATFLINDFINEEITYGGIDGKEALIALYYKHVKEADLVAQFKAICSKWEKLTIGSPSPTFSYLDINGKRVSLNDLKGKYVYIDVWATWCGPCRGEIPYLKKLEEKYHGKDIYFVSISCDENKTAWENMVKKEALSGIQLIMDNNKSFSNEYMISGIPRFILLDRKGQIVFANAPRPSNANISNTFDQLLAK